MTISPTLQTHLDRNHIEYDLIPHPPTTSSGSTAEACHISGRCVVKGVVLRRDDGGYVMAALPASHHIKLDDLEMQFGENFDFATEDELAELFPDCALGAIPPVGECYGLDLIADDSVHEPPEVYFEGGDHATLVHMTQAQFEKLTGTVPHAHFGDLD